MVPKSLETSGLEEWGESARPRGRGFHGGRRARVKVLRQEEQSGRGTKGILVLIEHRAKGSMALDEAGKEVARPCMALQNLLIISVFIPRSVGSH